MDVSVVLSGSGPGQQFIAILFHEFQIPVTASMQDQGQYLPEQHETSRGSVEHEIPAPPDFIRAGRVPVRAWH